MDTIHHSHMCHVTTNKENGNKEEDVTGEPLNSSIPWHHMQLIQLYGKKEAYEIINPKIEPKYKIKDDSKLRKKEGPTSAAQVWSLLRDDSYGRLLNQDRKISPSLKKSYGAFVRQLVLQKNEVPAKRNFCELEDVPDMDHLLEKTRLLKTLDTRHKVELMNRSSRLNQDKTALLLHNNPLPDVEVFEGKEGIDRYLPSWVDQNEESSAAYKQGAEKVKNSLLQVKPSDSMLELIRPRDLTRLQIAPRVTFLTEYEAGSEPGRFSEKFNQKQEEKGSLANTADPLSSLSGGNVYVRPFRGDNVTAPLNTHSKKKPACSNWEPLTLHALVEYSSNRPTHGEGKFLNGRVKMHQIQSAKSGL